MRLNLSQEMMVQDLQEKLSYELQDALVYMPETDDLAELARNCRPMDRLLKDRNSRKGCATPRTASTPAPAASAPSKPSLQPPFRTPFYRRVSPISKERHSSAQAGVWKGKGYVHLTVWVEGTSNLASSFISTRKFQSQAGPVNTEHLPPGSD
jgi:hypothetical protein